MVWQPGSGGHSLQICTTVKWKPTRKHRRCNQGVRAGTMLQQCAAVMCGGIQNQPYGAEACRMRRRVVNQRVVVKCRTVCMVGSARVKEPGRCIC